MKIQETYICYLPIEKIFVKVHVGHVFIPGGIQEMYFMERRERIEEIDKLYFKKIQKVY